MTHMKPREPLDDWEKELHRELMELPELEAPATLLPAVMHRLETPASSAWYHTAWWEWPLALRMASVLVVLAVLGVLGWASGTFGDLQLGQQVLLAWSELKAAITVVLHSGETLLGSNAEFWRLHGQIILMGIGAVLLATYLTCVAAGTALYRVAWRRIS